MATKVEETAIGTVERELAEFTKQKGDAETALKAELAKAKTEYDSLVKEITAKYNVEELTQKIKRHTYFAKLLKGEVAFPDDLEASRRKPKTASAKGVKLVSKYEDAKGNREKIFFVLNEIKSGTNDAVIEKLFSYDANTKGKTINLELSSLKKAGIIKSTGKEGKKDIYSI